MVFDSDWTRHNLAANDREERHQLDNLIKILEMRGDNQLDNLFLPQKIGMPKYFKPSGMMGMSSKTLIVLLILGETLGLIRRQDLP